MYADIILPLALPKRTYTYSVPVELANDLLAGIRVEVPFGKSKLYSGVVSRIHHEKPAYRIKSILAVLDDMPVVGARQLALWDWLADYYCCTLGEVMNAALPGHLKLTSETKLVYHPAYGDDFSELDDEEYLLAEALHLQQEITIDDARKILNKKTVFPAVQRLLQKGVLTLREDLQQKYQPKKVLAVRLAEPYRSNEDLLRGVFDELGRAEKQEEMLLAYLHLAQSRPWIRRQELVDKAGGSDAALRALVKKEVLELYEREISRLPGFEDELVEADSLSEPQQRALSEIHAAFREKEVVLLQGVTGSGKTRVYLELMHEVLLQGGQVLYLLPEIALTTQIINRLQRVFGADVAVYHSRINYNERVEIWRAASTGKPVLLSARSGLFLPFRNLQLIIVDEEHDSSFKQYDPAPRYNARDTAIYLASLYGAKVLLGTATPSLESYYNAKQGKFGLVEMTERFGGLQLPEIHPVDLRVHQKKRQMHGIFSPDLLDALKQALEQGEQAILFQNRRGYSPILECRTCGWTAQCRHCDVSLTYHKHQHRLRCHYCGFQEQTPAVCPACGDGKIALLGFGTEKIEDELKLFLPEARVGRMDLDTASSKNNLVALLNDFEEKRLDILVGTQMVTKGLDFDNVGIVGVLGADQLVRFPDFRAGERAYQLLTQVAGRAGRKHKRGRVLMQAWNPDHPVLKEVVNGDFAGFLARELQERRDFQYPPYFRLVHITLQHRDDKIVYLAADRFAKLLRQSMGKRVLGPVQPPVPRIRSYYGQQIMVKLEKSGQVITAAKDLIRKVSLEVSSQPGWGQLRIAVDVDPI
ncbi:MAG: primosomal protein N' [Bacteroidetes bacterium]|nr:MAG: primosomal protein N' [Bacteroidota bacterium]